MGPWTTLGQADSPRAAPNRGGRSLRGGDGRRRVHDKRDETKPEDAKIGRVVPEICSRADRQIDRHRQKNSSQYKVETVGDAYTTKEMKRHPKMVKTGL